MIDEVLPEAFAGERLDRAVATIAGCSRSVAAALISDEKVELDGQIVTQRSVRVEAGMRLSFPEVAETKVAVTAQSDVTYRVVHADDHVIVIDKPAGLIVHPGAGRPDATLVNGLLHQFPDISTVGEPGRPGIVHRLDGETSGLLAVARTQRSYEVFVERLAAHDVERIYTAVVAGSVTDDRGVIDAPIGRSTQRRTRMAVSVDGRPARTHYQVRARCQTKPAASLLRCELETGRTHQIRVHLSAIGHPVLGDRTYGNAVTSAAFDRVALHAAELAFEHPATGQMMRFQAPAPADLTGLIAASFPD